jgi:ubiquinone/menaquinone biosynthesis C-methylase UbiE
LKKIAAQKSQLKSLFTQYWAFLAVRAAAKIGVFDQLEKQNLSLDKLAEVCAVQPQVLAHLLAFLVEQRLIKKTINNNYRLRASGRLLCESSPHSLKNACLLWGEEHLTVWQALPLTLANGAPAFEQLFGQPFFEYLTDKPAKLRNYQLAMRDYARDDYQNIGKIHDFSPHEVIVDIGGGMGALLANIAKSCPKSRCVLFDLPEVAALSQPENIEIIAGDFFAPLPFAANAIILARVLHDWDDEKAAAILHNCRRVLHKGGRLYICEIMNERVEAHTLSLNMLLMCKSYERSTRQYEQLLAAAGFAIEKQKTINTLQTMLICKKIKVEKAKVEKTKVEKAKVEKAKVE